jgi:hypothetical protein
MQISRCFLVACGAAYCLALLPLCAADADADLKLREALEKKLNELQTQPPASAPQPKASAPARTAAPVAVPAAQPAPASVLAAPPPADSEAIAKAREALRQKMNELNTQPEQAVPQSVVVAPPASRKPAQAAMPAPAARPVPPAQLSQPVAQPAPVQTTAKPVLVAPPPVDSEAIAKAREALRQKMNELDMQPAAAQPAAVVAAPALVVQPQPVAAQPAPAVAPAIQPPAMPALAEPAPASAESIAKARTAVEQQMKQLETRPPVAAGSATAPTTLAPTKPTKRNQILQSFPPLQSPPPAIGADKEQRLQELLRKYKADQITPEQYHQDRAKILAEP